MPRLLRPGAHHLFDNDDFWAQGSADGEDGHQPQTEDDEIDAEDDLSRIKRTAGPPAGEKFPHEQRILGNDRDLGSEARAYTYLVTFKSNINVLSTV